MPLISDQAEATSSGNPLAGSIQMRILIELQVISLLLHREISVPEDLRQLRDDVARSLVSY